MELTVLPNNSSRIFVSFVGVPYQGKIKIVYFHLNFLSQKGINCGKPDGKGQTLPALALKAECSIEN